MSEQEELSPGENPEETVWKGEIRVREEDIKDLPLNHSFEDFDAGHTLVRDEDLEVMVESIRGELRRSLTRVHSLAYLDRISGIAKKYEKK
tara:strand:+ start:17382 stop:17654 length:273 start_codon:yes stop_codon:yes gene_type:complete